MSGTALRALPAAGRRIEVVGALGLVVLFALGALISGFTLPRRLDPFDEGLMMQAAQRVSQGQVAYRDFRFAYGPGQPLLLAGLFKAFGPSVLGWRVLRTLADAAVALLAYALLRRSVPRWVAVLGWLAAATAMAQPTSPNPYPPALALVLGALWVVTEGRSSTRRAVAAGALVALAAWWRPDFGAFGALAVAAALAVPGGPQRRRLVGAFAGTAGLAALVLYGPWIVLAGPGRLWEDLVATASRDGAYWTLPFPWGYTGSFRPWPPGDLARDLKDVVAFYVPLASVAGLVLVALATWWRRRAAPAAWVGAVVLGASLVVYLRSRADEFHVQALAAVTAAVLPAAAWWLWSAAGRRGARALALAAAFAFALVLVAGLSNRLSALVRPPRLASTSLAVASGVRIPPGEARALPQLVALVEGRVPPGAPIYVAPRRSDLVSFMDPLLYFLVQRPNPLPEDVALQARPAEQARIVSVLQRVRPRVVVRWTDPLSARREPNLRGRSTGDRTLDRFLTTRYRLLARFGAYDALEPR